MIDPKTNLEIGNPDRPPFGGLEEVDLTQLQGNVEKRLEHGIASASGIRQEDQYRRL
jgi:hypothetical protein